MIKFLVICLCISAHLSAQTIELQNDEFVVKTLEQITYNKVKNDFAINTISTQDHVNAFDSSKKDMEIVIALNIDENTCFSYYLAGDKEILLSATITSPQIEIGKGIQVGWTLARLAALLDIEIKPSIHQVNIDDSDGMIRIQLVFDKTRVLRSIQVVTSGYVD
jgi:hypothetical protein